VNYNDLESVRYVCRRYPVAALITEPLLQNIGVVKPHPAIWKACATWPMSSAFLAGVRRSEDRLPPCWRLSQLSA
jgi:acetylornithine/succinyldiaminopimelate/putrescine aminotransferase